MNLELKTNYWADLGAKQAFKSFIHEIHGLDFSTWDDAGYWDDLYTPFTFFKDESVVSSVCIYLLDALIDDRSTRLVQISGVGTLAAYRHQGLSRQLTSLGLEWAANRHEGVFLFADDEAIPYYQKTGFHPLDEYLEVIEAQPSSSCPGMIKLTPETPATQEKIFKSLNQRAPISSKFSVINARLDMFHVLYFFSDCLYEIPDLDCLVAFKRADRELRIFDIISARIPSFSELYPYLSQHDDARIEFHFHTDKLGINKVRAKELTGNNPYTKGSFPVQRPVFPFTSRA